MTGLSHMMPYYQTGYQQAINDNWSDLQKDNSIRAGQIQNLYNEAIFNPSVMRQYDNAAISRFNVMNGGIATLANILSSPGQYEMARLYNTWGPKTYVAQQELLQQMLPQLMQQRFNPYATGVNFGPNFDPNNAGTVPAPPNAQQAPVAGQQAGQPAGQAPTIADLEKAKAEIERQLEAARAARLTQ